MGAPAKEAGDDFVVGRTNKSEVRTLLVATSKSIGGEAPDGYEEEYVLDVSIVGNSIQVKNKALGVDAIHATGTVASTVTNTPAGNGVVGRGLNGLVGYAHGTARNRPEEQIVKAGVFGASNSIGLFGRGATGVVGCHQSASRSETFEISEMAGVIGHGQIGVTGRGENGAGVHGVADSPPGGAVNPGPGVHGESLSGPGVLAVGVTGVVARGKGGPGIHATEGSDRGGVFEALFTAQLRLVPLDSYIKSTSELVKPAQAGDLLALTTVDERGTEIASLWFCTVGGPPAQASWTKLA